MSALDTMDLSAGPMQHEKRDTPLAPSDARGDSLSEFRLEADVIRTADDVVGRRVRGVPLAAHDRRVFVAVVRVSRLALQGIHDGSVCIVIAVVGRPTTPGPDRLFLT